uniref:Thiosulfate sulfurtransferase like domain containing 3 n=1 Tax=Hucho hucho TaxID=62062 RepID=A0A4W5JQA2_9TELE
SAPHGLVLGPANGIWIGAGTSSGSAEGRKNNLRNIHATHKEYVLRSFSSSQLPETDVSYEKLKKLLATRTSVVIDVREPWELREYGNIPGSINVPLGQVNIALQLNPEEFKEKYGGDMPQPTDHIVFSCLAGIRSQKALDQAVSLGYKDVQHYAGGWQDWAKCEQES